MGAPKKKWSAEEETALVAGIGKHGQGKWSAILNDPEYHDILQARTNVDLKDKWRNITVMTNGIGHRQRGIGVPKHKHGKSTLKSQNKNLAATSDYPVEAKPAIVNKNVHIGAPKPVKTPKLQNKGLVATSGLPLVVVKPEMPEDLNNDVLIDPQSLDMEIVQVDSPKAEKYGTKHEIGTELQMLEENVEMVKPANYKAPVKHDINAYPKRWMDMTAEEAAIAAGEAVAEADAAVELAESAVREAEAAEQEAEAARNFAEATFRAYKCMVN